jgi:biopolymer transport protein ExbD
MAKREAPEINAGSMADIAFLLLIFFLVTTTMDKDTAYLRKIPKEVETLENTPPVQKKNIYTIIINSKQQIRARDSIIESDNIESLNSRIKYFYLVNRDKKTNREENYPYYAFGTKELYQRNLDNNYNKLDALESQENQTEMIEKTIDQTLVAIEKWNEKLKMINLYTQYSGKREMPEIAFEAHTRVESFIDTDYSAYIAVQSEIERAVTELRDEEAMELFGITYTNMKKYYQQKMLEDSPKVREYREKMDLIENLFPLRVIEVKPKR